MEFEFSPKPEIRAFDGRKLAGMDVEIVCEHTNADVNKDVRTPSDQYVRIARLADYPYLYATGWCGRVLGKKEEKLVRQVKSVHLLQAANGGRSDYNRYDTYKEYFNDKRKDLWVGKHAAGLFGAIMGPRGDNDRADIVFVFDDFELESSCWEFSRPQEWYSEAHRDNPSFRFVDGFYETAQAAIDRFGQKQHEDLFGERYFPVLVFPLSTERKKMEEITWRPKVTSDPIVTKDFVIFGTRCKPHEYAEVITMTYDAGGKVPIGLEWNWS
jgi:hypothetical protein